VTVVTSSLNILATTVAVAENMPHFCSVSVPHPLGMIPSLDVRKKADNAFEEILEKCTNWHPADKHVKKESYYPAKRFDFTGTVNDINSHFFSKGWSLGLPVLPPDSVIVDNLLSAIGRKPDEVLGHVPPQMGTLTVELVAVHAAMAGCRPEYMPVLIAALEGFLSPEANWRGTLATTGTTQFLIIVNGPIVKNVGIGFGQGSAGKGHHANASIGYAVNLIAYIVGGSKSPSVDKSTLASPSDYVCWVFGENEDALPEGWDPLHVERGFKTNDSVVTVAAGYPPIENIDHWSTTPEEHIRWWNHIVSPMHNAGGPCRPIALEQKPIIAIGPEHAHLLSSTGWRKDDVRNAFWKQNRIPLSAWPSGCTEGEKLEGKMGSLSADTLVPIVQSPEQLLIIVAGGDGKHSHYFPPFPRALPISIPVK